MKSKKVELIKKSRESAISAISIYNNPTIEFKSETFVVLIIIAWTYLLHAYYRSKDINYKYFSMSKTGNRKKYLKTKYGAYRYWELGKCLDSKFSPIDEITKKNLFFLIGLRNEIEHQMTEKIHDHLSAKFQACVFNYEKYIVELFGEKYSIKNNISIAIQMSTISNSQQKSLEFENMPIHIRRYIDEYEEKFTIETLNDIKYSYKLFFVQKLVNKVNKSDRVVEFISSDNEIAKDLNKEYYLIQEREKNKYTVSEIIAEVNKEFPNFSFDDFEKLRVKEKAKSKGYGIKLANTWFWYETWLNFILKELRK